MKQEAITINPKLLKEAKELMEINSDKELIEVALKRLIKSRKIIKKIEDLNEVRFNG